MFLQDLCEKVAKTTKARGSRTVSAGHLKLCIHTHEKLDFLKDIVAKVPDLPPSEKRMRNDDSDPDFEPGRKDGDVNRGRRKSSRKTRRMNIPDTGERYQDSSEEEKVVKGLQEGSREQAASNDMAREFPSGEPVLGLDLESFPPSASLLVPQTTNPVCIGDEEDDYD